MLSNIFIKSRKERGREEGASLARVRSQAWDVCSPHLTPSTKELRTPNKVRLPDPQHLAEGSNSTETGCFVAISLCLEMF